MPGRRFIALRATTIVLSLVALAVAAPSTAFGAVTVTRAELKSGELRVEGRGAVPNATITVSSDSVATARADGSGQFRVEAPSYRSSTCRVTVDDGVTSSDSPLAECATVVPSPSPAPEPAPASTLAIVDDVLPNGSVGTPYSGSLYSTGARGEEPVEYRLVSGRLPAGLSMTRSFGVASALITGTPTTVGTSSFTVEASDGSGQTARKAFTITVDPPAPLVITNISDELAPATVGIAYELQLFANGGIQPYSWTVVAGQLPPGLRLSSSGRISGTPTTAGTYAFTAQVADQPGGRTTRQFSISVSR